ncbi:MAG: nucleotidyl transferase AbiEii/AbiGii toxin family protein, partial [Deltaproteobacteria bacterium]|nr:nucleotidyl transferase AbiEii/AbiGii toxin family protein [Deltaproteobacteria bacterium]
GGFDRERLRLAFVVFGAMNRIDWRTITLDDAAVDTADLEQKLIPTLRSAWSENIRKEQFGEELVEDCRNLLSSLLPFTTLEQEFLDRILDRGEIAPELLTGDEALQTRIRRHPLLEWKAVNVRGHKRGS